MKRPISCEVFNKRVLWTRSVNPHEGGWPDAWIRLWWWSECWAVGFQTWVEFVTDTRFFSVMLLALNFEACITLRWWVMARFAAHRKLVVTKHLWRLRGPRAALAYLRGDKPTEEVR